eukprot:COSAG01_NODE_1616_length_9720_cov_16.818314_10_plen_81_part_00
MLQQLDSESDEDDIDYPSDGSGCESDPDDNPDDDKSIDIVYTDNESESDWSEHSSDRGFIDDTELEFSSDQTNIIIVNNK